MSTTVTIRDETTTGRDERVFTLDFTSERITVRELIRSRVYQEVKDYNSQSQEIYRGLVRPTNAENSLNGFKLRQPRKIEWEKQFKQALEGFNQNKFLIIVDDNQVENLDDEIRIDSIFSISFIRLLPLVGG